MRSNEHLRTFPFASGNQEKQKVLSLEIDVKFLVIRFLLLFRHLMTQSTEAHLCSMFDVESNKNGRQEKYCSQTPNISSLSDRAAHHSFPRILSKLL